MGCISIGNVMLPITPFLQGHKITYCTRCWCIEHLRSKCQTSSARYHICLEEVTEKPTYNYLQQRRCAQFDENHHSLSSQCQNIKTYKAHLKENVNIALSRCFLRRLEPLKQMPNINPDSFSLFSRQIQYVVSIWGSKQIPGQQSADKVNVLTALTIQLTVMTENNPRMEKKLKEMNVRFNYETQVLELLRWINVQQVSSSSSSSSLSRLTYMEGVEQELQLSSDGKHVLFRLWALSSGKVQTTQRRLYSLDLTNGQVDRLGKNFDGLVTQYTVKSGGGVYIIGQLGLNVQIYTQESLTDDAIYRQGWNGTYERFTASSHRAGGPVAFAFSSLERPKEVYLAESIDQLMSAKPITNDNELFTQRVLPQATAYHWKNTADNQVIEGVLHYPPGKFNAKNLPLLVLIHGGPNAASLNELQATWNWATMAATEGWLVLEPNYRGSTGYGDKFLGEIRHRPLSLPGQDILMGVDQLTKDGIADSKRLAVGGYSYGGFLTNWLITQTTRFNAALSGAGGIEHVSGWGTMDLPLLLSYLHGGFPWEVPQVYQSESPIYYMNRVRTPTHIVVGENDVRVDADQSFILERSLHYLGIPVQLLVFPNEGHAIANFPWSGKIKVREELKCQEPVLIHTTIRKNILFGRNSATDEEIYEAAKIANAYHFIMTLSDKCETQVGERGAALSDGQKQRIVQTTLIITHRLSTIHDADKIIVIQKEKMVEEDDYDSLIVICLLVLMETLANDFAQPKNNTGALCIRLGSDASVVQDTSGY
ncbi:unnamed protein product [Rotaria sp. Silwood1]|nr:unnamed protein product [Rotaria sp. Silwood1]